MIWWSFSCPLSSQAGNPNHLLSFRYRLEGSVVKPISETFLARVVILWLWAQTWQQGARMSLWCTGSFSCRHFSLSNSLSLSRSDPLHLSLKKGHSSNLLFLEWNPHHSCYIMTHSSLSQMFTPSFFPRTCAERLWGSFHRPHWDVTNSDRLNAFFVIYCFLKLLRPSKC